MVWVNGDRIQEQYQAHKETKAKVQKRRVAAEATLGNLQVEFSEVGRNLDDEGFLKAGINGEGDKVTVESLDETKLVLLIHPSGLIQVQRETGGEVTPLALLEPSDLENQATEILQDFVKWAVKRLDIHAQPRAYGRPEEKPEEETGWITKADPSWLRG